MLELFPQGGLGNQLLQYSYLSAIAQETGCSTAINPVLHSRIYAKLRHISWRQRSDLITRLHPCSDARLDKLTGLIRLKLSLRTGQCFTDNWSHESICQKLSELDDRSVLPLFGYFQRHQSLCVLSAPFWQQLATTLKRDHSPLIPFPSDQVVVHLRLGDYRWPENQRLFFQPSATELLTVALEWRSRLGGKGPISVVTDEPHTIQSQLLPIFENDIKILRGRDAEDDFLLLARHRNLVISNSTFSLCAGRLASELWKKRMTVAHPGRWFLDQAADAKHQNELNSCSFCTSFDNLLG